MLHRTLNDLLKALFEAQVQAVPEVVGKAFADLASDQRGAPEAAMHAIQASNIANQTYGFVVEHTGDLIHRMSEHVQHGVSGGQYVEGKVARVLRALHAGSAPFESYVAANARENFDYYVEGDGKDSTDKGYWSSPKPTVDDAMRELRRLGQKYADAHSKLPVYNRAQFNARSASVSLGLFNFYSADRHLRELRSMLVDADVWASEAMAYELDAEGRLVQYTGK